MICENISVIFALIGALVGSFGTVLAATITGYFYNKSKIQQEKMRLHNKESREAHKHLFVFSQELSNKVYPLASEKQQAFEDAMRTYLDKHRSDFLWFSPRIFDILCKFEERYLCLKEIDLQEETQEEMEHYFSSDELFDTLNTLTKEARENATKY